MTSATNASIDARVRDFIDLFSVASAALDLAALGECFADPFLSADASGSRPVSRAMFLQALPRRAQLFADAGLGRAVLTGIDHQHLDSHYVLVATEWTTPRTAGGDPVQLKSSFLLHDEGTRFRIVLYLNHQGPTPAATQPS